jgi:hypothetical protein
MADIKILDLTEATEITETTDYIPVVDTSDTTQDSTGTTKKATVRKLLGDRVLPDTIVGTTETQTLTNKTIDVGDNTLSGLLDWFYPIGTIYETTSSDLDTTTKMGNHFGGTWEVYGAGRVLVAKSSDTEFDTIGETGGEKTHTLSVAEMPSHTHSRPDSPTNNTGADWVGAKGTSAKTSRTTDPTGGGEAHNNLQPYIVVYRYRRIA